MKSDLAARFFGRGYELPNRFDDRVNFFVVFTDAFFELGKFSRQFAICFQYLA
jgi:hypothetical protein